jgi:Transposase IS116/IS110/IS902 family
LFTGDGDVWILVAHGMSNDGPGRIGGVRLITGFPCHVDRSRPHHRFGSKAHLASWNGTAPIDASSGDEVRHRLSRGSNRQINRVLHIISVVQLRHRDTDGRAY